MDFDRDKLSRQLLKDYSADMEGVEEEYFGDDEGSSLFSLKILVPVIFICVTGFITYAWYTDKFAISRTGVNNVPLIRADKSPVRVRPKDPGGMHIAYQDKKVYETISNDVKAELPEVTRLLPKPEEPVNRREIVEITSEDGEISKIVDDVLKNEKSRNDTKINVQRDGLDVDELFEEAKNRIDRPIYEKIIEDTKYNQALSQQKELRRRLRENMDKRAEELAKVEPAAGGDAANEKEVMEEEAPKLKKLTSEDIKKPETEKARVKKADPPKADVAGKSYKVQLGAFRSEQDVQKSWKVLKSRYGTILEGLESYTEKADLGEKGIFYRLKAGPLASEAKARKVCKELSEKKQGCLFVR